MPERSLHIHEKDYKKSFTIGDGVATIWDNMSNVHFVLMVDAYKCKYKNEKFFYCPDLIYVYLDYNRKVKIFNEYL